RPYLRSPGALSRRGWIGDRHRIRTGRRGAHATQRHRLLQVAAADRELVAGQLHSVDLPHALRQRTPQAFAPYSPARDVFSKLRRAVAAHHDVPDFVAGLGLPVPAQVRRGLERDEKREGGQHRGSDHGTNHTRGWFVCAAGDAAIGVAVSESTVTCPSHCFIIRTNTVHISGSNSRPLRSSRYAIVFSNDQASRYGRLVRNAS